jgi:ATP-dependent Clp protease ATP-binding subunit ClpA
MRHDLSKPVEQIISNAKKAAFDAGEIETKPEHLLYAIIIHKNNAATSILQRMKLQLSSMIEMLAEYLRIKPRSPESSEKDAMPLNAKCIAILKHAIREANAAGAKYVSTEHILIGMLTEKDQPEIFKKLGIVQHEENPCAINTGSAEKQIILVS